MKKPFMKKSSARPFRKHHNFRKKQAFAQSVGAFMPEITRQLFESFGHQRAALMADWETIIGAPLCHFTAPEEIKWKGAKNDSQNLEMGNQPPATLVIRVDGPAALEVQHQTRQIIEQINCYFGYKVIGDIRLLQAPLEPKAKKAEIKRFNLEKPVDAEPEFGPADDRLNTALIRLWRGIKNRQTS